MTAKSFTILLLVCLTTMASWTSMAQQSHASTIYLPTIVKALQSSPNNFLLETASYIGDVNSDTLRGVEIGIDDAVVLIGAMSTYQPANLTPVVLLGGGNGVVIQLHRGYFVVWRP